MRRPLVLAMLCATSPLLGQASTPVTPAVTWVIEYERTIARPHSEPVQFHERARMTVRSAKDSLFGDLAIPGARDSTRLLLRGTAKADAWTLYAEEPRPTGIAILLIPVDAAMAWLKEAMHGVAPTVVRFDLVQRGDSLTGTRTVTGYMDNKPRTSNVRGYRRP